VTPLAVAVPEIEAGRDDSAAKLSTGMGTLGDTLIRLDRVHDDSLG
jgi:hypothetical protein